MFGRNAAIRTYIHFNRNWNSYKCFSLVRQAKGPSTSELFCFCITHQILPNENVNETTYSDAAFLIEPLFIIYFLAFNLRRTMYNFESVSDTQASESCLCRSPRLISKFCEKVSHNKCLRSTDAFRFPKETYAHSAL